MKWFLIIAWEAGMCYIRLIIHSYESMSLLRSGSKIQSGFIPDLRLAKQDVADAFLVCHRRKYCCCWGESPKQKEERKTKTREEARRNRDKKQKLLLLYFSPLDVSLSPFFYCTVAIEGQTMTNSVESVPLSPFSSFLCHFALTPSFLLLPLPSIPLFCFLLLFFISPSCFAISSPPLLQFLPFTPHTHPRFLSPSLFTYHLSLSASLHLFLLLLSVTVPPISTVWLSKFSGIWISCVAGGCSFPGMTHSSRCQV